MAYTIFLEDQNLERTRMTRGRRVDTVFKKIEALNDDLISRFAYHTLVGLT